MNTRTIFYINVSHLPKAKVEIYLTEMKKWWNEQSIPIPGDQVMYIPVRDIDTHVEVLVYPQD